MEPSPKKKRLSGGVSSSSYVELPQDTEKSVLEAKGDWNKKDIWIVQLPKDLDPATLDGQKISLSRKCRLEVSSDKAKNKSLETLVQPMDVKRSTVVLLPSSKPGVLKCATSKMSMCVQHAIDVPPVRITSQPRSESKVEAPQGLKQRYKPFGWRKPAQMQVPSVPSTDRDSQKRTKHPLKK